MYYHLRFTPYDLPSDTIIQLVSKSERYVVAREEHKRDGTPCEKHYHIWMQLDRSLAVVRSYVLDILKIPKSGMGKNNKYYMLKAWDEKIDYILKQGKIELSKGFTEEELRPLPWKPEESQESPLDAQPIKKKIETQTMWSKILENSIKWEKLNKRKIEVEDALKIITRICVKNLQPLPHPGDRKRWAMSICMYSKMGALLDEPTEEKIEAAISDEITLFMAENMVSNKL